MSKSKVNCPLYACIQQFHEKHYKIKKSFKLKGFVLVNEEKSDVLSTFKSTDGFALAGYTNVPDCFLILPNMEDAKDLVDLVGKPLLICALHADGSDFNVCDITVSPILEYEPEMV
jgi:hypothetical protein